ncbi:unnamed protein product [Anisakis simplex]|uniref:Uncharacterized protein n=1 Tax=Anisakis simplex TaxID=6269 RepID=A0A3P6NP94_ANISI|nr:unnamed protein product [Anisakis simplex]
MDEIGKYAELDDIPLNAEEEQRLEEYLNDILSDRSPDVSKLNDEQAERLLKYVHFLQSTLLDSQGTALQNVHTRPIKIYSLFIGPMALSRIVTEHFEK